VRPNDGRRLDRKALETIRLRAVDQMLAGTRPEELAAALGFSPATVYGWLAAYRHGGRQALLARRAPGRPAKISPAQKLRLLTVITGAEPRELQLGSALWTRALVTQLLHNEFGVSLSAVSVGRMLARMGLSAHWPLRHISAHDLAFQRWLRTEYPAIRTRADGAGAAIYFAGQKTVPDARKEGSPRPGKAPVAAAGGPRPALTMTFAAGSRAEMRFAVHEGPPTAMTFARFCNRLQQDSPGPLYLIVADQLMSQEQGGGGPAASGDGRLSLFSRPPYPPGDSLGLAGLARLPPAMTEVLL
jgi:transposase